MSLSMFAGILNAAVALAFVIGVPALLLLAVHAYGRLQIERVRRQLKRISDESYFDILETINSFAQTKQTCVLLIDHGRNPATQVAESGWVGGQPKPFDGPIENKRFVLQFSVPPDLAEHPTPGKTFQLFESRLSKFEFFCKVADTQKAEAQRPTECDTVSIEARTLLAVHVPRLKHGQKYRNIYSPSLLLEQVPPLRDMLSRYGAKPEELLACVLAPTRIGFGFQMFDRIQIGGFPDWVQGPEWPVCPQCNGKTEFIAQVGLSASSILAKSKNDGVIYLFYCSKHKDAIRCINQFT